MKTFIIADDLELYIWDNLTFLLTGNPILLKDKSEEELRKESEERLAKIFGNDLDEKIQNLDGIINRLTSMNLNERCVLIIDY